MRLVQVAFILIVVVFSSACVTTRMQPTKQHKHLEASGGLSYAPTFDGVDAGGNGGEVGLARVDGQLMLGLFDIMDVSAHLGTTGGSHFAGMGTRFYPASWLTLGGQFEYRYGDYADLDIENDRQTADTFRGVLRASLLFYNNKYGGLYIGPQAIVHNVQFRSGADDFTMVTLGSFLGAEYKLGGYGAIQFEFAISPVLLHNSAPFVEDGRVRAFGESYFVSHFAQASVGYTIYFDELASSLRRLKW